MERDPKSHKGQNGIVAIVGGSRTMHGAPLLAALAAEASGADLVHVSLPHCHREVATMTSLNFIVHPFQVDKLTSQDRESILELLASMDCAILGPGISHEKEPVQALEEIIAEAACPLVLDASALQPSALASVRGKRAICTPHLGELERMGIDPNDLSETAKEYEITILLKGTTDRIAGPDGSEQIVEGGNAGLTVGGTGDVLAGLTGGLVAQKVEPPTACMIASTILKRAGEKLFEKKEYAYTAKDIVMLIPELLRSYKK